MAKGPLILKISGIVMFFQALLGFFIVLFSGLSLISMLNRRKALDEQLLNSSELLVLAIMVLLLITSIALFVCSLKSFNTYNRYLIPGGNEKYLVPSRYVLVLGSLTFLAGFALTAAPNGSKSEAVLIIIISTGWVLALLNLILVKKDREERAREEAAPVWKV